MGFNLKTWVNRISEYPTRRKLTKSDGSTELVTVERAEGQVSQEGNAFSADEMNDLEKRISDGFDELNSDLDKKAATGHKHTKTDITDFPSSMPASDVYAWAKAATKPSYTASEVGAATSSHTHDDRYYTEAEINAKFNSFSVPNLQVYFNDTNASNITDLLRKKCILALSKFSGSEGVCINYGGWSGKDFGLFIGQVKENEVKGMYTATHNSYRISYSGNTSVITYAEISCGSEIVSS